MDTSKKRARAWELYQLALLAILSGKRRVRGRGSVRQKLLSQLRDLGMQGKPAVAFADMVELHADRTVFELRLLSEQDAAIAALMPGQPVPDANGFEPFALNAEQQESMAWLTEGLAA